MSAFADLIGIQGLVFQIGLAGPKITSSGSSVLQAKNAANDAYADFEALTLRLFGDTIDLNEGAGESVNSWKYTLARPSTTQTIDCTITLPPDLGTPGYVLSTDGFGNTTWIAATGAGSGTASWDTTSLAFGDAGTVAMFTLPANAVVLEVRVIVDIAFTGAPSMSVGSAEDGGSVYLPSTALDLTATAGTCFIRYPTLAASGATRTVQISYSAGGADAGAARVLIEYAIPS